MNTANPETIGRIITRYKTVVGALNQMFQAASPRTTREAWRKDGLGSCAYIRNKEQSEIGLLEPAKDRLIELREARNRKFGGKSTLTGCPYHRAGYGCVLGDLKAPVCIRYSDPGSFMEWGARFGINTDDLRDEVDTVLKGILVHDPVRNDTNIPQYLESIERRIKVIKKEPMLYNPPFRDRMRNLWRNTTGLPRRLYNDWMWKHA